jgi:hypothetical protein
MTLTNLARFVAVLGLLVAALVRPAQAIDYTWDGTGDGVNWTDANNWDLNSGTPSTNVDRALFTTAANVTVGPTPLIHFLSTGNGLVQLTGSLFFGPNVSPQGVSVGNGGLIVNGNLSGGGGGIGVRDFSSAGNVVINGTLAMVAGVPVQTAGTWDITSLVLPNGNLNIGNWNFIDGANTTITNSFTTGTYTFTGQPTFAGGRPNWIFNSGGDGGHILQLGNKTLFGNQLSLGSWPAPGVTRHTELQSNGGTLDLNTLNVLAGNPGAGSVWNYINVDNGTITIQGTSGTVWNNQSNENVLFDVRTNTNTTINPTGTGNTVSVDTGSQNQGLSGFTNNFAFHNLTLGASDTVQLTGTDYTGGGNTALYVNGTLTGQNLATLNLNTRAAFVNGSLAIGNSGPGKFTVSNGDLSLTSSATATFDIAGTGAGTGYDQLVMINGVLHLNGAALSLNLSALAPGLYVLVDNQGASAIDGTFAGLAHGSSVNLIGASPDFSAYISYTGNAATSSFLGGNDIVLQVFQVPEPSSLMVWGLGAAVLVVRRRRKSA